MQKDSALLIRHLDGLTVYTNGKISVTDANGGNYLIEPGKSITAGKKGGVFSISNATQTTINGHAVSVEITGEHSISKGEAHSCTEAYVDDDAPDKIIDCTITPDNALSFSSLHPRLDKLFGETNVIAH